MPTDKECKDIDRKKRNNPSTSLTSEEMCLDTLATIPKLSERLEFFRFHCSFQSEEEVKSVHYCMWISDSCILS